MKEFAKKILSDVSAKKEFVLHHNGKVRKVKNLIDLRVELEHMPDGEFVHHVGSGKNDFAKWIDLSIGDEKLAHDLHHIDDRVEMIKLIKHRIDFAISVIEKENDAVLKDELKQIKKLSSEVADTPKIKTQIHLLEKDVKKAKEVADIEKKILEDRDYGNDFEIIPWDKLNPIPANARLTEFVFGLVIGLLIGVIIGRVFWGF